MLSSRRASGVTSSKQASAPPAPRPMYSFPELRVSEILQCMEDLRVPLQENELTKPTPVTIQRLFEAFLDIFMGRKVEESAVSGATETLENPDLHVEAVSLIEFFRAAQKLAVCVGINDFSLRDVIKPEGPRFKLILSGIINFAKFREEQLALFRSSL